jgi:hypothetical protein
VPKYASPDCEIIRLAVADGATETSFAGLWAQLLVRLYGRHQVSLDLPDVGLCRIRKIWKKCVTKRPLPWYAEAKVQMGAFSSLLGLSISKATSENGNEGSWTALGVGDSCLFQIRGDDCLVAFPLESSEGFSSRPALLSSAPDSFLADVPKFRKAGSWVPGDVFYLMTDALACWFLRRWEVSADPLECLRGVGGQADFERLVTRERSGALPDASPLLRNDDVTLICCQMTNDES